MNLLRRVLRRGAADTAAPRYPQLQEAAQRMAGFVPRTVLLIVDTEPERGAAELEARYPGARVVVLDAGPATGANHDDLFDAAAGEARVDLVVDARTDPSAQKYWAFRRLFLGLRDGGHYLVLGVSREDPTTDPTPAPVIVDPYRRPVEVTPVAASLDAWLDRLSDARRWSIARRRRGLTRFEQQLVPAVGEVVRGDAYRIVTKVGEHLVKPAPEAARSLLERRGARFQELTRRAARTITTPVRLHTNDPELSAARFPATEQVPELVCRVYENAVCAPRQVVSVAGLLLPESYVQPWRRPLGQLTGNVTASEYGTAPGQGGGGRRARGDVLPSRQRGAGPLRALPDP